MKRSPRFEVSPPRHSPAPERKENDLPDPREAAARLEEHGVIEMIRSGYSTEFVADLVNGGILGKRIEKSLGPARKFLKNSGESRPIPEVQKSLVATVQFHAARIEKLAEMHERSTPLIEAARRFREFGRVKETALNAYHQAEAEADKLPELLRPLRPEPWSGKEWEKAYEDLKESVELVRGSVESYAVLHRYTASQEGFLNDLRGERAALRSQRASVESLKNLIEGVPRKQKLPMGTYVGAIRDAYLPIPKRLLAHLEKAFQWEFSKDKAFTMFDAKHVLGLVHGQVVEERHPYTGHKMDSSRLEMKKIPYEEY
jgi:hypothetical protein